MTKAAPVWESRWEQEAAGSHVLLDQLMRTLPVSWRCASQLVFHPDLYMGVICQTAFCGHCKLQQELLTL